MQNEATVNANIANCLVTKSHFGFDVIINICNGHQQTIPWTFGDWVAFVALGGLGLFLGTLLILFVGFVIKVILEECF